MFCLLSKFVVFPHSKAGGRGRRFADEYTKVERLLDPVKAFSLKGYISTRLFSSWYFTVQILRGSILHDGDSMESMRANSEHPQKNGEKLKKTTAN